MQAFAIICASLGFKRACKLILTYPALVLTPCFGTWTFGPVKQQNYSTSNCCTTCKSDLLVVSYMHTWVNYAISLSSSILTVFVFNKVESFCKILDRFESILLNGGCGYWKVQWALSSQKAARRIHVSGSGCAASVKRGCVLESRQVHIMQTHALKVC